MVTNISADATARREAARQGGRFGVQAHTAPESALDVHETEMVQGETREMPFTRSDSGWHTGETISLATGIAEVSAVRGTVTRNVWEPTEQLDPSAVYSVTLSNAEGDVQHFTYETGNQAFELVTPTIAEVLADTADAANSERGAVTDAGDVTTLDRLIRLLGEHNARELLAQTYVP